MWSESIQYPTWASVVILLHKALKLAKSKSSKLIMYASDTWFYVVGTLDPESRGEAKKRKEPWRGKRKEEHRHEDEGEVDRKRKEIQRRWTKKRMRNQRFCFLYRHQVSSSKPIYLPAAYRDLNHLRSDPKSPTTKKKNNETIEEETLLSDDQSEIQRESTERDRLLCALSLFLSLSKKRLRWEEEEEVEKETQSLLFITVLFLFFSLTEPYSLFAFFLLLNYCCVLALFLVPSPNIHWFFRHYTSKHF